MVKKDLRYSAFDRKVPIFELSIYAHNSNGDYTLNAYIGYTLKKILRKYNEEIILQTNSLGLRDKELERIKKVDTIFLGSSLVYGAYSPLQELTFPKIYNDLSNNTVLNAGMGGHNLPQHVALYFRYLKNINTKNVVLFFGYNEFLSFYEEKNIDGGLLLDFQRLIKDVHSKPLDVSIKILFKAFKRKSKSSYFYSFFYKIIFFILRRKKYKSSNINNESKKLDKDKITNFTDFYIKDIECLNDFYEKRNINFNFILQPSLIFKKNKYDLESDILDQLSDEKKNNLMIFYQNLRNKLKSFNNFHDFSNIFDNEEQSIFVDNVHVADRGNKILAKRLLDIIV